MDWYPWCDEAFDRAKAEDKPIFLSIGYSTCHWCHVMAHECFADEEIAALLNESFICIKVDKEERPDIDSIYMSVCQAFTGSGGWPTSIFMTPEQQPFFAGTYFPKHSHRGMPGLMELLTIIREQWEDNREMLFAQANRLIAQLRQQSNMSRRREKEDDLPQKAMMQFQRMYDRQYGGFGRAPKFPMPHNLLFLLSYYQRYEEQSCLAMAEHTLTQLYRGGIFDHIGGGFCRYSTDREFLVPHFEKMLYDNAMLILAYSRAYALTKKPLYRKAAKRTADYVLREMTAEEGGFYSAQDADSDGKEGSYYLFSPEEIVSVLGKQEGEAFCAQFDITEAGNFEGKSIPNLLRSDLPDDSWDAMLLHLRAYRKTRYALHLDDKILTFWNGLMIAALCELYRVSGEHAYLYAACRAERFLSEHLWDGASLFVSFRDGKRGVKGFLDDYAGYIFALLSLYGATLDGAYLEKAQQLCEIVFREFADVQTGGYYLYGAQSEPLILRPKESDDGALPSGNSLIAWNLVRLSELTGAPEYCEAAKHQLAFLASEAADYPAGYAMYLTALLEKEQPSMRIVAVGVGEKEKKLLPLSVDPDSIVILAEPSEQYPLKDGKPTYYVCKGNSCLPPVHDLHKLL